MSEASRTTEKHGNRCGPKAKPVKGVGRKPGIEWLKPGLIARVRYLKGEEMLRHATLQEVRERDG